MLFLDFFVLFHIAKVSLYFIVLKAERIKIEGKPITKCEALTGVWAVSLILANCLMMIIKALLAPLPLLSEEKLGSDLMQDLFKYIFEPLVQLMVGLTILYLFHSMAKAALYYRSNR